MRFAWSLVLIIAIISSSWANVSANLLIYTSDEWIDHSNGQVKYNIELILPTFIMTDQNSTFSYSVEFKDMDEGWVINWLALSIAFDGASVNYVGQPFSSRFLYLQNRTVQELSGQSFSGSVTFYLPHTKLQIAPNQTLTILYFLNADLSIKDSFNGTSEFVYNHHSMDPNIHIASVYASDWVSRTEKSYDLLNIDIPWTSVIVVVGFIALTGIYSFVQSRRKRNQKF